LTFNRAQRHSGTFFTGFMLPPIQTMESVEVAVGNIRRIQARIGVPFAFETPVNYLRPRHGEMSDGSFFAEVALRADCGIPLDLHNVWCNERNGRQSIASLLEELPLDRVWEMHLADGRNVDGFWVDAHSGLIPEDLIELTYSVVPQLPNLKAIMFEIMPDYMVASTITVDDVIDQAERMHDIWEQRGTAAAVPKDREKPGRTTSRVTVNQWEQALGGLVAGQEGDDNVLRKQLADDAGTAIYRKMAESVRAGMIAEVLTLTFRLLMLSRGEEGLQPYLRRFWGTQPPKQAALAEARCFAKWLANESDVEHAGEVATFEIASHDVTLNEEVRVVDFSCEPMTLLTALGEGRLPEELVEGRFELALEPEAQSK
jgi:hypothetical protein